MRAFVLVVLVGLLCTGCIASVGSIKSSSDTQYLKLVEEYGDAEKFGPQAFRTAEDTLVIGLYGSSSCSPNPTSVSVQGSEINIALKKHQGACTADYGGPFPFTIRLGDNAPKTDSWTVILDGNKESIVSVVDAT